MLTHWISFDYFQLAYKCRTCTLRKKCCASVESCTISSYMTRLRTSFYYFKASCNCCSALNCYCTTKVCLLLILSMQIAPSSTSKYAYCSTMPQILTIVFQCILLGLGGSLTTAYFISDVICAPPSHPIRAILFCTTTFMTGICTFSQALFGVR